MHRRDIVSLAGALMAGAGLASADSWLAADAVRDLRLSPLGEGAAFADFLAALQRCAAIMEEFAARGTELDRVEGLRFLTRMIAASSLRIPRRPRYSVSSHRCASTRAMPPTSSTTAPLSAVISRIG